MKTRPNTLAPAANEPKRGFTLLECIVYIGMLAVLMGIGMRVFWRSWDANRALRRNAGDIVLALHAGEQWRADVRAAAGTIQLENTEAGQCLHIPVPDGEVVYTVVQGEVHRHGPGANDAVLLTRVDSSRMQSDPREHVLAWRWELELRRERKGAGMHPLFAFEAVPGTGDIR